MKPKCFYIFRFTYLIMYTKFWDQDHNRLTFQYYWQQFYHEHKLEYAVDQARCYIWVKGESYSSRLYPGDSTCVNS